MINALTAAARPTHPIRAPVSRTRREGSEPIDLFGRCSPQPLRLQLPRGGPDEADLPIALENRGLDGGQIARAKLAPS